MVYAYPYFDDRVDSWCVILEVLFVKWFYELRVDKIAFDIYSVMRF